MQIFLLVKQYSRKKVTMTRSLRVRGALFLAISLIVSGFTSCAADIGAPADVGGHISISGSTALQPLVQDAATRFMKLHSHAKIDVAGGGSITGLQQVTASKINVGDSDIYADPAIYPDPNLTDHIVCVEPFTMIVNPDVDVSSLKKDDIIKIFSTGGYYNWSQVGGPNIAIKPVVRPATSGTRDTFRKYILDGRDEIGQLLDKDSTQLVLQTVAATPGAIGYIALSWLNTSVRQVAIDNSLPTKDAIASGKYTFWAYEHMYTLGDDNPLIAAFLDYMLSTEIQNQAQHMSYIPIGSMQLLTAKGSQQSSIFPLAIIPESEDSNHATT